MFDLGFSELLVIGFVALVVIGPERLPKVARAAGQWLGKLNRYVSQVKQDIDRDIKLDELRKMQQEMKDTAQKYEIMAGETKREIEESAHGLETAVREETGQISRVMEAMSATDGGLAMREYEKIKAEEAAKTSGALPAPSPDATVAPPTENLAASAPTETRSAQPVKSTRVPDENPDGTTG